MTLQRKIIPLFFLLIFISVSGFTQAILPYKNSKLSTDERINDLLSRMTVEEKFWQLFMIPGEMKKGDEEKYKDGIFGFQISAAGENKDAAQQMLRYGNSENAIELAKKINATQKYFVEQSRLGIPIIFFDEALHGLVRSNATVFPQAIGLAATWDTTMMHKVAGAIAGEAKACGIRQILSPVINIASDVRWGRTEETYGEDPFLTSEMGVAFVGEFEKRNIITTPKHFIANVGDGGRDSYPIHFNERLLDEIYLAPFKAVIDRGGARSIMTAYNSLDGIPCSANDWLLNKKLKREWGFKGFVISDAGATGGANVLHYTARDYTDATQQSITNGLDVIFQTDYEHYRLFIPPFLNGSIEMKNIDAAVQRVLRAKFELGLFENPYVNEKDVAKNFHSNEHIEIAKQAALESIVLLKNEKKTLPLDKSVKSLAVIGTDATEARMGGYSGHSIEPVNILDGIKNKVSKNTKVIYAPGCGRETKEWNVIESKYLSCLSNGKLKGLYAEYFNNITLEGKPALTRVDDNINFNWTLFPPDAKLNPDFYSVRWTGKLRAPETGKFKIGLDGNDGFRLYLNNQLIIDNWKKQTYSTLLTDYTFKKDSLYNIRVEFFQPNGNAHIKLIWNVDVIDNWKTKISEAVNAAKNTDAAIIVAGITEGEFQDRAMLNLPGHQEELIQQIAATGKPIIVLLVGGSAITMNKWLDKVNCVIDVWYSGEQGGNAIADVLFGDYNPAGRLPITFPISEAQLPLVYNHKPTGRGDDYNNLSGLPLFPFGFGLSYTTFEYSEIRFDKNTISKTDSTTVRFKIKNTGTVEGDEVQQLYIRDLLSSVARPVMELKGFQRIHILPGETKEVSFLITPELLSLLDEKLQTVVESGDFKIMIGASSADIKLMEVLTVR